MTSKIPSIHEAFNARSLTTEELCRSFIVSEHFEKLAAPNSTIMIGPRGSGKTTLMRMLQVQSLEIWEHKLANEYRTQIGFSGVFIPTDRVWKTQFDKAFEKFGSSHNDLSILQSSFTYHVLERLVSTLEFRASRTLDKHNHFRTISLSKSNEAELVAELAHLWKVKPRISSLKSLEIAITTKKHEISNYIMSILSQKEANLSIPEIVGGPIEAILGNSIRVINIHLDEREHKWAFLFDELELAPESIVQPLVNSMRGGPDNIVFKLSLSPYHRNVTITSLPDSSMKDQDLGFISLTSTSDVFGMKFSTELCENIFKKHDLSEIPVNKYFESPSEMVEIKEFEELFDKDPTFELYLASQGIGLEQFDSYTEKDKRPTIRKVKFVVELRNYYRKAGGKKSRRRPPNLYAGFENICKAMEYNPRMLIGIMNKFVPYAKEHGQIPIHQQLSYLDETTNSFKALLSTISVNVEDVKSQINTIYDLVEKIASYFSDQISGDQFFPEPKGSLTFGKIDNDSLFEAIGFALNSGAFIAEKGTNVDSHDIVDIKKIRCRLSHMFSHKYGLLLTTPRDVDLSEILVPKSKKTALQNSKVTGDLFPDLKQQ